MKSNKIFIEKNPNGLYQVRFEINGNKGVYSEEVDLTLEKALGWVDGFTSALLIEHGIRVKQKNILISPQSVAENAPFDESSMMYLNSLKPSMN